MSSHNDARKLLAIWSFREPTAAEAHGVGDYIDQQEGRDTRIAELEAEVARLQVFSSPTPYEPIEPYDGEKCVADLKHALGPGAAFYPHHYSGNARLDAIGLLNRAQSPTPPAPEARGNPPLAEVIKQFQAEAPDAFSDLEEEKPSEAEEPAIVRRLRGLVGSSVTYALTHADPEIRELLAFIDGRKGG